MKVKPWHGKLNHVENKCPHCGAEDEYSDVKITVMQLSAQHYKLCTKCQGEYVDTYLIHFIDSDDDDQAYWEERRLWEEEDNAKLFEDLNKKEALIYDEDNPNEDSVYYNVPLQSVHFIKED